MYKHCSEIGNDPSDLAEDADLLIMGITPSGKGKLHAGHHLTLFNYLRTLAGTESARGLIHVDDREFCFQLNPRVTPEGLSRTLEGLIHESVAAVATHLHDSGLQERVTVKRMSEIFLEPIPTGVNFGARFLDMLDSRRGDVSTAFQGMDLHGHCGIRPFCPECDQGYVKKPRHNKLEPGRIVGECHTPDCEVDRYAVEVAQGDTRWSVFYGLVSLMSVPLSEQMKGGSILEFLGGDYGMGWGKANRQDGTLLSKGARAAIATERMSGAPGRINHYVGPLLQKGGGKLSKSKGDEAGAINCAELESWLSRGTPIIDIATE